MKIDTSDCLKADGTIDDELFGGKLIRLEINKLCSKFDGHDIQIYYLYKQLQKLVACSNREQMQKESLEIVALLSSFDLFYFSHLEEAYLKGLKDCVKTEGTKSGGEMLMASTLLAKEYRFSKSLRSRAESALPILSMYTGK